MEAIKLTLIVTLTVAALAMVVALAVASSKKDDANQAALDKSAIKLSIEKAKSECKKEGLSSNVCNTITVASDITECSGKVCWIVYARSKGPGYGASITVEQNEQSKLIITDYLRDTGTQQ